jgi:preprotein translocase subunit YajC
MDLLFPLLIVFMIGMIFFSSRQRKKQAAQQESLQNAISVGDVVVMTSGISGTVVDTDDDKTIDLEIAPDVITTWLRAAVREKLAGDADVLLGDHERLGDHEHLGDHERLGEAPTVVDSEHSAIADAPVDRTAPTHGTSAPASNGTASHGTASHGTATPATGSDGAAAEPSFSDPTATPNGNGVSASTPGDQRS